jgi:hypothetical protein
MVIDTVDVNVFTQRRIEIQLLNRLFKEFSKELGDTKTEEVIQRVVNDLAKEHGKQAADEYGGNTTRHLASALKIFTMGGSDEMEIIELTKDKFSFNVLRCRYAEMYKELGLEELGLILSCNRDFAFAKGFNPDMELIRTKTILEGADQCDFRYRLKKKE